MAQMNLSAKQKQTHRDIKNRFVVAKGSGRERDGLGVWDW